MSFHLICHATNPFPGQWVEAGPGHFHVRLGGGLWFMSYWR